MNRQIISLSIIVLLILGVLGTFVIYNQWPLLTGKKIVLDTRPVDPFDPFRGQYMAIAYEISRINNSGYEVGEVVYVSLKEDDKGIWRYSGSSNTKPSKGDFIRGEVIYESGDFVSVQYGIEQFFFERGADVPTTNITVEAKVASSGRAGFVQLLQNGKPVVIKYKDWELTS